jgi:putative (di)nucleoside polyphosphate hydrolase
MLNYFLIMSQNQYFRIGAGCVIYTENGEIIIFRRNEDKEIWQFPQGGLNPDEDMLSGMWRELSEETGLTPVDIAEVSTYPGWLHYEYTPELRLDLKDSNCWGQMHRWFYLKLKPEVVIDLSKATEHELVEFRKVSFDEFLTHRDLIKHEVYVKLAEHFKNLV